MQNNSKENPKRPELLRVLCVLSFIGGGVSIVSNGFMFLFLDDWVRAYEEGAFDALNGSIEIEAIRVFLDVDKQFFLLQGLFYSVSVYGVYLMWNFRKTGFHAYSIAQILILILQKVFIPSLPFPLFPLLLTLTFIILYSKNLSYMR